MPAGIAFGWTDLTHHGIPSGNSVAPTFAVAVLRVPAVQDPAAAGRMRALAGEWGAQTSG